MEIGQILRIDDVVTGFDDNKTGRPCMVVRIEAPPRSGAWVLPRSTRPPGTKTPGGLLPGLDRVGWFMYLPHRVSGEDLADCPSLGQFPESHRARVLENVNDVQIDVNP